MLNSDYRALGPISFPAFTGRQVKYHTIDLARIDMPTGFEAYMAPVMRLCREAGATSGEAYVTVDESVIEAGRSQRRPRPHVDGRFVAERMDWSHPPAPAWLHHCNDIGAGKPSRMSVIVAASVEGCRAWRGQFIGRPGPDGDLTHISYQLERGEVLPAGVGYMLSPDCVHESMIFAERVERAFLRIALPLDYRFSP